MPRTLSIAVALVVLATACRVQTNPEPSNNQLSLVTLGGSWIGEYTITETGKSGTLSLALRAGTDSAVGDVVLIPYGGTAFRSVDGQLHLSHAAAPEVLHVTFLRVAQGMIEGAVEPYYSADCSCTVKTVFQGAPGKNRIDGEFFTSSAKGLRQQGRWSVQRQLVASR